MEINTTKEVSSKTPLENLSKEDLIKKCKGLLSIAQKAKQTKDSLSIECNELKEKLNDVVKKNEEESKASTLLIENLTQQKLNLFMTLEELKKQHQESEKQLVSCQAELKESKFKLNNLDNENQSQIRQIKRLTDENEELIIHLERLENDIQDFKKANVAENTSENSLEEKNSKIIELQSMLAHSLEEVKKNQIHAADLNEEIKGYKIVMNEKDKAMQELENKCKKMQDDLQTKTKIIEKTTNEMDDLNTELHKNRAVIEKLQRDVSDTKIKLNESQITGSQVTGDLENTNEKLKAKLKTYRMKIIKIASDIKVLKQTKENLLTTIAESTEQVQKWKEQLQMFNNLLIKEINASSAEKIRLLNELSEIKLFVEKLETEKNELNIQLQESQNNILSFEKENINVENYETQINLLQNEQEKLLLELKDSKSAIDILKAENEQLSIKINNYDALINEESKKSEKISDMGNKLQTMQQEQDKLLEELMTAKNTVKYMENQQQEFINQVSKEQEKCEKETKERLESEKKAKDLESQLLETKNVLQFKEDNILALDHKLKVSQELFKNEKDNFIQQINDLNLQVNDGKKDQELNKLKKEVSDLTDKLKTSKRENSELLAEMNEMNEVLKERGETISKQQQYCEDILNKLDLYEKQLSEAKKHVDAMAEKDNKIKELKIEMENLKQEHNQENNCIVSQEIVDEKDNKIKELEKELEILREKLYQAESQEGNYPESECMSTSTVSRIDEASRLKDLEGSWEERYGKLRNLALKLKGKVKEQATQLTQEQNEKTELQNKLVTTSKNIQLLQTQCDEFQDKLEVSKQESKKLMKQLETSAQDLSKDKNKLATNDETISALQMELENFKLEKKTVENSNKNLLSQIQSLKKENEANTVLKREFENKISKLEMDILSRDKTINEEIEKHKATKLQLQELNKECKSKSVLNLEMQDYERSLKDLTQKLEKRQDLINDLQSTVDSQQNTITVLREEVRLLEDRILNEESELTNARTETSSVKKQLSDTESLISQKDNRIHEVMNSLEICRAENEQINAQLAKVIKDNQKMYESIRSEKEQYRIQVVSLEQNISELKDNLKIKCEELENLQKDYEGYKIRAQSVLRQNQTRDVGTEERLNEELTNLRGKVKMFEEQLKNLQTKYDDLEQTNNTVSLEKDKAKSKLEETSAQLETQKHSFKELEMRYQQAISDHAEAVRSLKVHADTLAQCYRQQLAEQEALHSEEIKELKNILEKNVFPTAEDQVYTPPAMPREECEGSESVESGNSSNLLPNPLEKLLNSSGDSEAELVATKEQLVQHEARLKHLTGLLADAEQDLAKHVQMNQLLKEEIRRQQRSVEREQHAENLEYLKNVVVKFITLNNGDERSRLIPVLNTILKLSPEETNQLNAVVNGDTSGRGWGSYLPIWNSPKPSS